MRESPPAGPRGIFFLAGCAAALAVLVFAIVAFLIFRETTRNNTPVSRFIVTGTPRSSDSDAIPTERPLPSTFPILSPSPTLLPVLTLEPQPPVQNEIPTITPVPRQPTVLPATLPVPQPFDTSLPKPGQIVRRFGNGPDAPATYLPNNQFALDGALNEWTREAVPLSLAHFGANAWAGADDSSGAAWFGWNEDALLVAVSVRDEAHVQTQRSWEMFRGDSVELWIDADLARDFESAQGSSDDWQFGFSPGDFFSGAPEGVVYIPHRDVRLNQQIQVAALQNGNGYTLEARIPWALLGTTPARGKFFGYTLDLSDNDVPNTAQQQTQVTHNPNFQFNVPTTFGNLILE